MVWAVYPWMMVLPNCRSISRTGLKLIIPREKLAVKVFDWYVRLLATEAYLLFYTHTEHINSVKRGA